MAPIDRDMSEDFARFSPGVASAWSDSNLGGISTAARRELLETAIQFDLAGGESVPLAFPATGPLEGTGQPGLVVYGFLRVYVTSQLRQVTTQYASAGDVFGIPSLIGESGNSRIEASAQALHDTRLLLFSPATFTDLVGRDLSVAQATIAGLRGALIASVSLVAENVLWRLRQRVARHLLDLAVRTGPEVVVPATVQTIADATGTVREVVTRLLKEMREEGLILRRNGSLVLLDLHALHQVASGDADDLL
jgi:CRP-like cAMP-binding protein